MKTAKEWREKFPILIGGNDKEQVIASYTSFIQEIQLDAMKEGMRRAAEVAKSKPYERPSEPSMHNYITQAILASAEQLTEKDL